LKEKIAEQKKENQEPYISIGHTRWATHGSKTDINAHPHHDNKDRISIVHNGIIENFCSLKKDLIQKGYKFISQTDTEVISVLIGYYLDNDFSMTDAIKQTVSQLKGTWALVMIHRKYPNKIWITRNGSPLLLGIEEDFVMVASEQIAFHNYIKHYVVLNNQDVIEVSLNDKKISYNINIQEYKTRTKQRTDIIELSPIGYDHWTIKEIYEQPDSVLRAMNNGGRILSDSTVKLGGLDSNKTNLQDIDHIILLGCGTSLHSGLWVVDIFKGLDIFDTVSIYDGADFNKRDIPKKGKVAAILISQSGETKDLHRCIQIIQENNMISIGVVNVIDSFIARESDCGVYLNAGREVAVASTKSFTNQCIVLSLIAIWFSQNKKTCLEKRKRIIKDLHNLPFQMKEVLKMENIEKIKQISRTIHFTNSLFILGKGKEEAIAKEGALKIKEITYIHAEGYSSSALKHGPFGLIVPGLPIILFDVNDKYREKNENVLQEVNARGANVLKISDENGELIIKKNHTYGGILANIYIQLMSYYCALEKGLNPDFPRNLAKVVTVE
jgi:glucosamine--fructose-6-phosphate aminotransferase (isomerizing)